MSTIRGRIFWVGLVLAGCLQNASRATGDETNPVRWGREALRDTDQPWYDDATDQVRTVAPMPLDQEPRRADWQRSVERPDWNWNPDFTFVGDLLTVLGWAVLAILIALAAYFLVQAYLNLDAKRVGPAVSAAGREDDAIAEQRRIENLPIQMPKTEGDFLALARTSYEQADFAAATIYLFSYQLLQLDRAGLLRLEKGKTNRQYLREVQHPPEMRPILARTMSAFEDVFFGRHPLPRERFESCWGQQDEFQRLLQGVRS